MFGICLGFGIFFTMFQVRSGHRQPVIDKSEETLILELMLTLEWTSVTVIYNDTDTSDLDILLVGLHTRGLYTAVLDDANQVPLPANTPHNSGLFVLGSFSFVEQVFRTHEEGVLQTERRAREMNRTSALFDTEWMARIEEGYIPRLQDAVRHFENVAVLVHLTAGGLSLWTMRHVLDDSQLRLVSCLPPPAPDRLTRHQILPNPSQGLGGRTLRVVMKPYSAYLIKSTKDKHVYEGVLMEIFRGLSTTLNFSYTFLDPPDDSWGQMLENGQWDGPIGMLARKEADLAVSAFVLTPGRSSVADPTTPYTVVSTVIVFKIPRERPEYFLQPFQTPVYVAIGGGFLAVLCLLLLLGTFRREPAGDGEISSEAVSFVHRLLVDCEVLLAGLLNRPIEHDNDSRPWRGLVWVWMMFGVVLSSVYSSKLTATLAVGDQVLPFTTLAQLVNQDTFTWGVMSGTAEASILKNSTDKDFKAFYQSAVRFSHTDPSVFSPDEEGVQKSKVKTGNYAYFSPFENLYEKWSSEICDLAKIPERYLTLPWVFYLQKGSPYTKLMSERITSMVDTGLVDHWIRQWFPESSPEHCSSPSNGQSNTRTTALTVRETQTAFYMAALGVGLAALTLGTELFIARLKVFLQFLLHRRRF